MKDSCWYFILGIISLALFIYTLWKKRDLKLITLYLFVAGITFTFEFIILLLFNSYSYHPGIVNNGTYDSIVGSFFSNAIAVPMTAVFIAAFNLNLYFILAISAVLVGIEILFVNLGIYKHNWWQYSYTFIGLIINFLIARKWYYYLRYNTTVKIRAYTILFSNITITGIIGFFLIIFLDAFIFKFGYFDNPYRENLIIFSLYSYFFSLVVMLIIIKGINWLYTLLLVIIFLIIDYILIANEMFVLNNGFSLLYIFLARMIVIIFFKLLGRHMFRKLQD